MWRTSATNGDNILDSGKAEKGNLEIQESLIDFYALCKKCGHLQTLINQKNLYGSFRISKKFHSGLKLTLIYFAKFSSTLSATP